MKIAIIGGGPAGLYFAILMKIASADHDITVYERNRPYDTFGWGVVFSDQTLENLKGGDEITQGEIINGLAHWDDIEVHFKGRVLTSGGHGFCGIERKELLNILQRRAESLGVALVFDTHIRDVADVGHVDLIVAADGVNSSVRSRFADHFRPDVKLGRNKFVWLGTHKVFNAFKFIFAETEHGWFQAHAYRFNATTSTFIVETQEETWRKAGLEDASTEATIAYCEQLFAPWLDGNSLLTNRRDGRGSDWLNFSLVKNERWTKDNIVLVGDAAHTAHFSIGSGTKLALEDAIALAQACEAEADIPSALERYESERRIGVLKIQSAAQNSTDWFEHVDRYAGLEPEQFAYSMLTRSQRISHENLRLRDHAFVDDYEDWLARKANATKRPPMFLPFTLRGMTLANRVVNAPVELYRAHDGIPDDLYLAHFAARALGGAGLVMAGMAGVNAQGRLTPGCTGLWNQAQADAWRRIADFVHAHSHAKFGLQLGHSGPKGSTKPSWEGASRPLDAGNWELIAPSPLAWSSANQVPREMTVADMEQVCEAFANSVRLAIAADFDLLEIQAGHGTLLSAFISKLSNHRTDAYGGDLARRLAFPLQVFRRARSIWPESRPLAVRISAIDWAPGGTTAEEAVMIARAFADAGADLIDVSSGETSVHSKPIYGRMYQTPFADRIRNEVGIPTIAVGNITEADQMNSILAAGRADLCAIGRPHLADPNFTLRAAASAGYRQQAWPMQYVDGKRQMEHVFRRAQESAM